MADDKLGRIEDKIGKIENHLQKQEVSLARLTVSVEHHVKRTDLLEDKYQADIKPLKEHDNLLSAAFKIVVFLSIVLTIADIAMKFLGK